MATSISTGSVLSSNVSFGSIRWFDGTSSPGRHFDGIDTVCPLWLTTVISGHCRPDRWKSRCRYRRPWGVSPRSFGKRATAHLPPKVVHVLGLDCTTDVSCIVLKWGFILFHKWTKQLIFIGNFFTSPSKSRGPNMWICPYMNIWICIYEYVVLLTCSNLLFSACYELFLNIFVVFFLVVRLWWATCLFWLPVAWFSC